MITSPPRIWTTCSTPRSRATTLPEAHVFVDMCYAGGFLKKCSSAPEGTKRLVITSTTEDRLANFGTSSGALSFTAFFLSAAIQGNTFYESFQVARQAIVALNLPAGYPQLPWLDDNGDGIPTKHDGALARQIVLGNNPAFGFLPPRINEVRPYELLEDPEDFEIWCEIGPGEILRVDAVVSHKGSTYTEGEPITITTTNLTFLELTQEADTSRWTAILPKSVLEERGDFNILYTVLRDDGFGIPLTSPPMAGRMRVKEPAHVEKNSWVLYE